MFNEFHFQNSVLFLQALSCTFHVALDDGRYEFCPLLRFLFYFFNTWFHKAGFKQPAGMSGDSDGTSRTGPRVCVVVSISCHFYTPVEFGHMRSPFLTTPFPSPRTQQEVGLACPQQNNRLRLTSVIQSCSSLRRFRDVDMNPHGHVNTSPRSNMCRKPFHMTRNMLTLNLHTAYCHGKWLLFIRWADLATEENVWKVCVSAEAELNPHNIC